MTIHDDLREVMGCPFCGETPSVSEREFLGEYPIWTVQCHNNECGAQRVMVEDCSKDEAIATWNTRPALLARQEGEEGSLRFIAKRNLRRMIEIGSTDTKTMLLCLEELS